MVKLILKSTWIENGSTYLLFWGKLIDCKILVCSLLPSTSAMPETLNQLESCDSCWVWAFRMNLQTVSRAISLGLWISIQIWEDELVRRDHDQPVPALWGRNHMSLRGTRGNGPEVALLFCLAFILSNKDTCSFVLVLVLSGQLAFFFTISCLTQESHCFRPIPFLANVPRCFLTEQTEGGGRLAAPSPPACTRFISDFPFLINFFVSPISYFFILIL